MKFCNQDISKSIATRSFKLSQQIEDNDFFFKLMPFENLDVESLISPKLLQLGA